MLSLRAFRPRPECLALLLSLAGIPLLCTPAHAAYWVVSYTAVGMYNGNPAAPWPTNPIPGQGGTVSFSVSTPGCVCPNTCAPSASSAGSATPVFTWTAGRPGDPTPAPRSLYAREVVHVNACTNDATHGGALATTDGFSDQPQVALATDHNPWMSAIDEAHFDRVDVPAGLTFGQSVTGHAVPMLASAAMALNVCPQGNPNPGASCMLTVVAEQPINLTSTLSPSPQFDSTNPAYLSGTGCTLAASASVSPHMLAEAILTVNGEVKGDFVPNPQYPTSTAGFRAVFDSSHWSDGTNVTVDLQLKDDQGVMNWVDLTGPVYNKTYVLGNQTTLYGQTAAGYVTARVAGAYWDPVQSTSDTATTIIGNIPVYTGFYIYNHGAAGLFGDCLNNGVGNTVAPSDVAGAVATKVANKWPPYNIVYIHACDCADDSSLSNAFAIGPPDTCFMSFYGHVDDSQHNANWSNSFWQELAGGDTVSAAINDANYDSGKPQNGGADAVPRTYGDSAATMHNTAYGHAKGQWYVTQP